jgi:hypothetical protein
MRRIELDMKNQRVYEVIKELVDHEGNKLRAAVELCCSKRTIDRYITGYLAEGKAYFIHGNKGRRPANVLKEEDVSDIVDLYANKYHGTNISHFTELLHRVEGITVSESSVRQILSGKDILSPKAWRRTKRELKAKLKSLLSSAKGKKEIERIKTKIVGVEDAHPRRPRAAYFGEVIQMDASLHLWAGGRKWTLHIAIDDATGIIVGAWFDTQETLRGYYNVFSQILLNYGIPFKFLTDRRTIFEYRKGGAQDVADDSFTQFSYACKQLGVHVETTSVAQAKGRVERLIQSTQSRLPVELRLKGVSTIEQANEYLPVFIELYNARFALQPDSIPSVFVAQPSREKVDLVLAVITQRTVDSGHSIRFDNKYFRTLNQYGLPQYYYQGTKGLVVRTFSGGLFFSVDDQVHALEEIPSHERRSKNFDFPPPEEKPKKRYIPPTSHPWKLTYFTEYLKKQGRLSA